VEPIPGKISADGEWLRLAGLPKAFELAPGHYLKRPPPQFVAERATDGSILRVFGVDRANGMAAILWPAYSARVAHPAGNFVLHTATSRAQRRAANAFLDVEHHRGRPPAGTTLIMLPESGAAADTIVGCAVVAEDTHTNYRGRSAFAAAILGPDWRRFRYDEILRGLRLVTGRRYALAEPLHHHRLGDVLAAHLGIVAAAHRWPPANWLEVARHMPGSELFRAASDPSADFLTRTGYRPVPPFRRSPTTAYDRTASPSDPLYFGYFYREIASLRAPYVELDAALAAIA